MAVRVGVQIKPGSGISVANSALIVEIPVQSIGTNDGGVVKIVIHRIAANIPNLVNVIGSIRRNVDVELAVFVNIAVAREDGIPRVFDGSFNVHIIVLTDDRYRETALLEQGGGTKWKVSGKAIEFRLGKAQTALALATLALAATSITKVT